jgi:hypothetical protein
MRSVTEKLFVCDDGNDASQMFGVRQQFENDVALGRPGEQEKGLDYHG